jgi:anti-sigma factor RsiW
MRKGHDRSCRELVEQLSRFVDGDLSAADRRDVAQHLRHCPCCDDFVESLRRTVALCHEAGRTNLPPAVRARARRRISTLLAQVPGTRATARSRH